MSNATEDSLCDLFCSDDVEDGDDVEDDKDNTELGKLTKGVTSSWMIHTISKMVQYRVGGFRQQQLRLDELTQPRWRDEDDYFIESDIKYGMVELKVPAAVKDHTDMTVATPSPTISGEPMGTLDIVPRKL